MRYGPLCELDDSVDLLLKSLGIAFDTMPSEVMFGDDEDLRMYISDNIQTWAVNEKINEDIYEACFKYISSYLYGLDSSDLNFKWMREACILLNLTSHRLQLLIFLKSCTPLDIKFIEFLNSISKTIDLDELGAYFIEQEDPELYKQYWKFLSHNNVEYWGRMDLLFRKRLANLPRAELEKVV